MEQVVKSTKCFLNPNLKCGSECELFARLDEMPGDNEGCILRLYMMATLER